MLLVSNFIEKVIADPDNDRLLRQIEEEIRELCSKFPAPGLEHLC
jgi:glycine hydroxymethyltransferase